MMHEVKENALIAQLAALLPHRPTQVNGLQESDAELIRLPGEGNRILAVTTDGIVEEIDAGLYKDPYLIGWMTVMANLSDLAAVGADPVGLLVAETLPRGISDSDVIALQTGIRDACLHTGTPVLGGDTNFSDRLHTTGTAIGLISDGPPLMRVQCKPGEALFCTGFLGTGNAYAALHTMGTAVHDDILYRPTARLQEGASLRSCASTCMDTSDGLLATLDQLGRLNACGFELTGALEDIIAPDALRVASQTGLAPWMLLAAPHGEFELVFTVPECRIDALHRAAERAGWAPIRIGMATEEPGLVSSDWERLTPDDLAAIRNYTLDTAADRLAFPRFLANLAEKRGKSTKR